MFEQINSIINKWASREWRVTKTCMQWVVVGTKTTARFPNIRFYSRIRFYQTKNIPITHR